MPRGSNGGNTLVRQRTSSRPSGAVSIVITGIYLAAFLFFIGKMCFYSRYVGGFPDEIEHISYIAYLNANPNRFIPQFRDMQVLAVQTAGPADGSLTALSGMSGTFTLTGGFNYLCHPPLYYQIMRLANGVTPAGGGTWQIHLLRLRAMSMAIAALGMLVVLYLGWSRIGRYPSLHLLYAGICVSVPMLAYVSAGVNNDTLALLTISLLAWGMLRLYEKKRTVGTYLLISVGASASIMTKYTAGVIAILFCVFAFLALIIREKSLKVLLRREFWPSLPVYLTALLYVIAVYRQVGHIQADFPHLCPDGYLTSGFYVPVSQRISLTFTQYSTRFITNFLHTWTDIIATATLYKDAPIYSAARIGIMLVAAIPLLLFLPWQKRRRQCSLPLLRAGFFSVATTAAVQLIRGYVQYRNVSGYLGGYQSRYYLCGIVWLGMGTVWIFKQLRGPDSPPQLMERKSRRTAWNRLHIRHAAVSLICLIFVSLLIYEDFIYFIWNYHALLK